MLNNVLLIDGEGVPAVRKSRRSPVEAVPQNLPVPLTSFVGRRRDVTALRGLLTHARLVTLTGAAGVGKTRLALRVAEGLRSRFVDGVWLIELASLTDARLVPRVVASTLGQRDETAVSPDVAGGSTTSGLVAMLRSRQTLLILDNCEHLTTAVVVMVDHLLRSCPDLWVLATSREPLGVVGESV